MSEDLIAKAYDEAYGKESLSNHFYETIPKNSEEPETPHILDSGNRRQFESGAVRDIQEGKGRCDLLPLDVVAEFFRSHGDSSSVGGAVLDEIAAFQNDGDYKHLLKVLDIGDPFDNLCYCTMLLEVAIHFEEGAKKYGDNNWRRGIPVHCYIDSGVRHYLKFLRGDKDEPHDRAFCWNIMCAIWTCKHKPELNGYAVKKVGEDMAKGFCEGFHIPKKILLGKDDCAKPMEEPV